MVTCKGSITVLSPSGGSNFKPGDSLPVKVRVENLGDVYCLSGKCSYVEVQLKDLYSAKVWSHDRVYLDHGLGSGTRDFTLNLDIPIGMLSGTYRLWNTFLCGCGSKYCLDPYNYSHGNEIRINVEEVVAEPANIVVTSLNTYRDGSMAENEMGVRVTISNTGGQYGTKRTYFKLDGNVVDESSLGMFPGQSTSFSFVLTNLTDGSHTLCGDGKCTDFVIEISEPPPPPPELPPELPPPEIKLPCELLDVKLEVI